jgi:hypothetical protein
MMKRRDKIVLWTSAVMLAVLLVFTVWSELRQVPAAPESTHDPIVVVLATQMAEEPTATAVAEPEELVTEQTVAPTSTLEPTATKEPVSEEVVAGEIQFDEPLQITLDDFGSKVFYDDRFPRDGQIWDQSYWEGWILVLNAYAIHDHDFVSQNGCVVAYYQAPAEGERIRFTGWDGMAFELAPDSGITLNQAIATMRETLIRAHGCNPEAIQYHELFRHGDPVK